MSTAVELTEEEMTEHMKRIKSIRRKCERVREKYFNEDISVRKYRKKISEIEGEERLYLQESGIFLFYGKLYKRTK